MEVDATLRHWDSHFRQVFGLLKGQERSKP
jgi:hypothetical protein